MTRRQRIVLEKGVITSLEQRMQILERFKAYEKEVELIEGATISFITEPLVGKEVDGNSLIKDSTIMELLDGNAHHFLIALQNPNMYRFHDNDEFVCNMKSNYMIYMEFELDKHFGEIEEDTEDFSWCLED